MQSGGAGRGRETLDCGAQKEPVGVEGDDGGGVILSPDAGWDGNFCRDSRKDGDNLKIKMKKQISKETFAGNTLFPKLYGKTYWGSFKYTGEEEQKQICLNRNAFAQKYELMRFPWKDKFLWRLKSYYPHSSLDHAELYASGSIGVLLLVSNYDGAPPDVLNMGESLCKLYSLETKSYFRRWESKDRFEKHLKALLDLIETREILDDRLKNMDSLNF
jgi:hypothetical protein